MTKEEREREERERMLSPEMTIEEYERIIGQATDETNAAMAQKNAAEAAALANIASTGTEAFATQTGKGASGQTGNYLSVQEQQQKQAEVEQATKQSTSSVQMPQGEPEKKPEPKQQSVELTQKQAPMQAKINADAAKLANDNLVQTSTNSLGETKVQELPSEGDVEMRNLQGINAEQRQLFSDYINQQVQRQKQEEEEMRRQEKADMWATMGTGATELAAGIINMLGVGELNATNQVYHSYSQDWMRKADQNIRENRQRRQSMRDTLDRLNLQMAELKNAQSIKELEMARQLRKEKKAEERQAAEDAIAKEKWEWQKKHTEKQEETQAAVQARQDKETDATIAQGWARINAEKDKKKTAMLSAGYVPDKNVPGGYKYDPDAAKALIGNIPTKGDKSEEIEIPLLANGNLPAEVIKVKDGDALKTIILSNIDGVTDLLDSQKQAIIELMENNELDASKKAEQLKRYLVSSGQLRSLFKRDSTGNADTQPGWLFRSYQQPQQ